MNKGLSALLMTIGVVAYLLVLVLQLFSFMSNVGFLLFPVIGILAQIALGLPVLMHLGGKLELPLLAYTKVLACLVTVLAISGYLGMPTRAVEWGSRLSSASYDDDIRDVEEELGAYEIMELRVELAGAESEDETKRINKEIEDVGKRLSEKDKKALEREKKVYEARRRLSNWDRDTRSFNIAVGNLDNALVIIAAFLMLAGAYLAGRPAEDESSTAA